MARGKHKNAAEARRVREQALADAEALSKQVRRLESELAETQGRLNSTLEALHSETTRLRLIIAAGETEATEALHTQVRDLTNRLSTARGDFARDVRDLATRHDVRAPKEFWTAFAEMGGVQTADFYGLTDGSRHQRRLTPSKVRQINAMVDEADANGIKLTGRR